MKIRELTPRQSRIVAITLLLAMIALTIAIIAVPAFLLHRHYDQAIEQRVDLLVRYLRVGATGPELARQLEALKAKGGRSFFLKSTVPALAASEVQETIKGVVESNGGKITSMQIAEHKDDGNYRRVPVSIQISATVGATQKIFYVLETRRPYFLLDNVSIRSMNWKAPRDPNILGPETEYAVQFDVAGYAVLGEK